MKLSDVKCRQAKAKERPYKLAGGYGLYLFVAPNGARLWRCDYRFDGKRQTMSIGPYPEVTLVEARDALYVARKVLRDGRNPMEEKRVERVTAKVARATTFGLVADELLTKLEREQRARATVDKRRWLLKDLASVLCERPIAAITPAEVLALLRSVEARGHLETARRLRAAVGQVMRLAVATNRAQSDPTASLRGAIASPKVTHRAAITDKDGAGRLMVAIQGYDRTVVRSAMLIMAYCFPRPGECRQARWSEIDFKEKVWLIPAERTKMRRDHRIPLSSQALATLRDLHQLTGIQLDGLCFPGQRTMRRPISENTIGVALRTLGFANEEMSAHGFRALSASRCARADLLALENRDAAPARAPESGSADAEFSRDLFERNEFNVHDSSRTLCPNSAHERRDWHVNAPGMRAYPSPSSPKTRCTGRIRVAPVA